MKRIILLFILLGLFSCKKVDNSSGKSIETEEITYSEVIIEGCQYIQVDNGSGNTRVYSLTHKGNCTNHNGSIKDSIY